MTITKTMTIDWTHFTPWHSLAGGLLIGLAAALLILFNGRVLGVSGIVSGLIRAKRAESYWRLAFVIGVIVSPLAYRLFDDLPESHLDTDWAMLIIAGLLVGYGTRLGSGCTSGHGVCGLSRGSLRSLVATGVFMLAGFSTVYLAQHLLALA